MEHHFNVEIATKYGMLEAVLLNNLYFWIKKNEANGTNYHDGYYWTYNSTKAFHELFPYASANKIRNALKGLEQEGLIITGNYNKSAYDRTMWYALTEIAISILQNYKMDTPKKENGNEENIKPIPNNKPDNKPDNKKNIYSPIVDHLNEVCGTHYRVTSGKTKRLIDDRFKEGFTVNDFFTVIDKKASVWIGTEFEKYLRPETLFGTKFESYLNEKIRSKNPFLDMLKEMGHDNR